MTESARRRKSKWDLKADTCLTTEGGHDNAWFEKVDEPIHDKDSKSVWDSPKISGGHDLKWSVTEANKGTRSKDNYGWPCWESGPGNKGAQKDDAIAQTTLSWGGSGNKGAQKDENVDRDRNAISQTMAWSRNQSYSTSMSPGLDAWQQRTCSRSPKSDRSRSCRSRSRSPPRGLKQLEGRNERGRSASGVSLPCRDFAAGRCRRGSQCRFLHQDNYDYDDRRQSESGPSESGRFRHEREGSSRDVNPEEERDYSGDKTFHGYRNHHGGDRDKHEFPRNNRSNNVCNDFLKGRCHRGSSCKYAHHDDSADGHVGWSTKEVARERPYDGRDTNASIEHDNRRGPRRMGDTPCKFFPYGKCRNGDQCRFSHDGPERGDPEESSRDDRWSRNLNNESKSWGGPKWSEATDNAKPAGWGDQDSGKMAASEPMALGSYMDDRWGHNLVKESKSWGGPKWSETTTVSNIAKPTGWGDQGSGKMAAPEPRAPGSCMDDRLGHNLENENKTWGDSTQSDKAADQDVQRSSQWGSEDNGVTMGVPKSRDGRKSLDATYFPSDAGNTERYPHFDKVGPQHVPQDSHSQALNEMNLRTHKQNMAQEVSGQQQHAAAFCSDNNSAITDSARSQSDVNFSVNVLPVVPVPGQNFNQGGQSVGTQPVSSINVNMQSQQILLSHLPSGQSFNLNGQGQQINSEPSISQSQKLCHDGESTKKLEMGAEISQIASGIPVTQKLVTSEKVAQITNLSASLAQIFGNGQQLPQLYAALNPTNVTGSVPSHPKYAGTAAPTGQLNQSNWSQKQYDPVADSMESSKPDINSQPSDLLPNPIEQIKSVAEESLIPSNTLISSPVNGGSSGGDLFKNGCSKEEPIVDCEGKEKNETAGAQNKKEQENGHSEDMEADGQEDEEGKRSKNAKGMRMFKFALVEFVKEILKPTWKEGQMSKEAHKTIVKKVIDKVTGTLQGAIPQTQDKIDLYLSHSKPKLTKLVQAYVEKYLKC